MSKSDLEAAFDTHWKRHGNGVMPVHEHRFHPTRRWRFDRAWLREQVAVELEGGVFSGGRHVRGKGFEADCAKYNAAVQNGWRVLRFTSGMLKAEPILCMAQIVSVLKGGV